MRKTWDSILNYGYSDGLSEQEIKRLHLVNSISVLCNLVTFFALIINFIFGNTLLMWTCVVTISGFSLAILLNGWKKHIAATFIFLTCPFYFALATVYGYGNAMEIEYIMLLIPIAGFMLFEQKKNQVILFVISILVLILLKALYLIYEPLYEPQYSMVLEMVASISAIIMGFMLMQMFQKDSLEARKQTKEVLKNLQKANQELKDKEKALTQKNQELEMQIQLREAAVTAKGESETKYQMLFENGFDGILLFDLNTLKTVGCNQKMLEFFETDLEDLKQATIFDYLSSEQPNGVITRRVIEETMKKIRKNGRISYSNLYRSRKGKRLAAQVTAVLSPPPNDHIAVAIFKDIMPEWNAREKIVEANRELTNFAHAASHDLREPLRMIHSFGQLLERRNKSQFDKSSKEFLHFIIDASERMTSLVQDLLEYATTGTNLKEAKEVDLNDLIFTIHNNLHVKIQETGAIIHSNDLPKIFAHRTLITQLFQNIISNGLKFKKADEAPEIMIKSQKCDNHFLFTISDNGIGIEPQNQQKIFDVFRRLHSKQEYEGSGIGLATCKKIMDKYGGKIWAESEVGIGTTFFLQFPKKILTQREESPIIKGTLKVVA